MSYQKQGQQPMLGATFVPGGFDDYYMPAPAPELVSPSPQRVMPEVPEQMQDNIAHLELEADVPRGSQQASPHWPAQPSGQPQVHSVNATGAVVDQQQRPQSYSALAQADEDIPNFSPFPKLVNPPPNVPPTDEQKEGILENARVPVLNSNDPDMQLAWAQDALAYAATAQAYEDRVAALDNKAVRPATPAVEHQIKIDAMNIVEFLAQQHHPKAEFMKGMWLEFGNFGMRQDKREAFRCYARSAEKGFARAEYRMGMQFEQNNDPVKALIHYQRGAEAGDSASNYRLGMMTLMGQMGQPQDYVKGIHMLQIAAQDADENAPQGAYVLGMLQARELPQVTVPENLLPYDERAARENIEKAAYLGFAKAQVKMGAAYELCALGCEFDPALSLHYNALAARQGEAEAEMAISKWFLCGHDKIFKKNEELAYVYANRAAQSGLPTAEFAMGYFYEIGLHVPANLEKAMEWYQKAADHGNDDAKGRIEGLNKSQTLSKKDHENVAINRIKSQYGSKRGGRPARFKAQAPVLGTVTDEPEEYGQPASSGRSTVPPRGSSITPYPESDGPPKINEPPRPSTVAPYPLDDRPPQVGGRPGFAGGFAPELRSASAAPQQMHTGSGGAFQINPDIYNQGSAGPQQSLPMRPATTINEMRANGGRPQNQRVSSGPAQMGGRPPRMDSAPPSAPPKIDIGYQAPIQGGRGNGGAPRPQPGVNDIGYVAPLQPRKSPIQSPIDQGQHQNLQRPPRADSRVHGDGGSRPLPSQNPMQRPATTDRPHRQDSPGRMAGGLPATPSPGGRKDNNKPTPHPSLAPPKPVGSGPKTFDAMGIPQAPKESECIIM